MIRCPASLPSAQSGARLGDEIALVDPFVSAAPTGCFLSPVGQSGAADRVVEHSQDDIVAVCDETGNTIPLTKADLIVHEVERRGLAGRLADAFGLEANGPVEDWDGQTIRLGQAALDSTKYATSSPSPRSRLTFISLPQISSRTDRRPLF